MRMKNNVALSQIVRIPFHVECARARVCVCSLFSFNYFELSWPLLFFESIFCVHFSIGEKIMLVGKIFCSQIATRITRIVYVFSSYTQCRVSFIFGWGLKHLNWKQMNLCSGWEECQCLSITKENKHPVTMKKRWQNTQLFMKWRKQKKIDDRKKSHCVNTIALHMHCTK